MFYRLLMLPSYCIVVYIIYLLSFSSSFLCFFINFLKSIMCSDRTLKVWSFDGVSDGAGNIPNLKAKAIVAAHDKDINSIAVAPNDSLVCSGSQVCITWVFITNSSTSCMLLI